MKKKIGGLLILLVTYIIATVIGVASFNLLKGQVDVIWNILIADVIVILAIQSHRKPKLANF